MGKLIGIARRDRKRGAMQKLSSAEVDSSSGVANDFRGRPGKRQVTILSNEAWRAACSEAGADLHWTTRRANLLVENLHLPQQPGRVVCIGDLRLEITMETAPCSRMDEQHHGLRDALAPDWRGGVCCRVLSGGTIRVGDTVSVESGDGGESASR